MKLCLAPMDGITDSAFRIITKKIFDKYKKSWDELYLFTEFMSADGYVHNPRAVAKHILHTDMENNLTFQIFGNKMDFLVQTAIDLQKKYKPFCIELNIGCPAPKVVAHGSGSGMLKDKTKTLEIIKILRQNITTKFSIKTRSWLNLDDRQPQFDFVLAAGEYCDFISLHGRTFKQWHSGEVDWQFIYDIKKQINSKCEIFGNWWIKQYWDIADRLGNLDGIMIWQSSIWDPWIFVEHIPSLEEKGETIIMHLDLMIALEIWFKTADFVDNILKMPSLEDLKNILKNYQTLDKDFIAWLKSTIEFRKHIFAYFKGIADTHRFKQKIIWITDYLVLRQEIFDFFNLGTDYEKYI